MTRRTFTPKSAYTSHGWYAQVWAGGNLPYWRGPRCTGFGARLAARRMARKFNRLEKRGLVP